MGALQYATDNDQQLFPRLNFDVRFCKADALDKNGRWTRAGDPIGWHRETDRYVRSKDVFFCTAASTASERLKVHPIESPYSNRRQLTSYLTSDKWWVMSKQSAGFMLIRLDQLPIQSREGYLWEVHWNPEEFHESTLPGHKLQNYHQGKSNLFFLDGSVRTEDIYDNSSLPGEGDGVVVGG